MASKASKKHKTNPPKGRPVSTTSLSHPPLQDSSSLPILSAFSPNVDLFAIVSLAVDKHRLRVHDTDTGRCVSEYVVDSARVTALSWAAFSSPSSLSNDQETEDSAPRKKRKKRDPRAQLSVSESDPIPVVVLGLSTGSVIIFSPSHARVIRSLSHPSSASSILSSDVSAHIPGAALLLFTSGADGFIRTWNAQTGELVSSSKIDDHLPSTSLSLRPGVELDHPSFLLAHHSIRLLSVSSDSLLTSPQKLTEQARFIGHASDVTMLRWQPSEYDGQSPRRFASASETDHHVHLWKVPHVSGSEGKLVASAPLDSDARHISFSQSPSHPALLVLSSSGRIAIFTPPTDQAATPVSQKMKGKVATLSPRSSATISFKRGATSAQVINAAFEQEGRIRVAWLAGHVRPVFDVVRYLDNSGDFVQDVNIVHEDASAGLLDVDGHVTAAPNKRYVEPSSLAVHSGTEIAQDASADDLVDLEGHLDVDLAELSLGQRLTALEPPASRPADAERSDSDDAEHPGPRASRDERPNSLTLTRTLIQALHSADTKLIETCLAYSDPTLITQTVQRLPPQLTVPLLGACVQRLGRPTAPGSQRAAALVRWVRAVLVVHSGHLMTMPDLVARLAGLHATLTARLALRESLLSLSGRLDMVLQQVDLRAAVAPVPLAHGGKKGSVPATREPRQYVEGESEEEEEEEEEEADAMDVELEEGSDVGSVEDVELGAESGSEDEDEDEGGEEGLEEDDSEDGEEDIEGDEGPWLNGFMDDEAEEDEEDEESENE
ncbi:WD40 repeat-like protein [Russula earlei]|uniref:WD40 repeat-like protein n=1 Tax=Russula earlei TaxID=71964 RepID=A0ACC0UF20_9AGAM|nr:WD40 repeat-like protein [Russula earlei]